MHGVLIIEDVCCKKNYWYPVKSIYPSSIFFLHSGRGVVPRWSRKLRLWRTASPTGDRGDEAMR